MLSPQFSKAKFDVVLFAIAVGKPQIERFDIGVGRFVSVYSQEQSTEQINAYVNVSFSKRHRRNEQKTDLALKRGNISSLLFQDKLLCKMFCIALVTLRK